MTLSSKYLVSVFTTVTGPETHFSVPFYFTITMIFHLVYLHIFIYDFLRLVTKDEHYKQFYLSIKTIFCKKPYMLSDE